MAIVLAEQHFVVLWCIVCALRVATLIVLANYLWYWHWLTKDDSIQLGWRRDLHALSARSMQRVVVFLLVMLLLHLYKTWEMLQASFVENRMVFRPTKSFHLGASLRQRSLMDKLRHRKQRISHAIWHSRLCGRHRWIHVAHKRSLSAYSFVVELLGFVGIRSKWFNEVFAIRESVELATQTYQVYILNILIADDITNGIAVMALFVSSTSTHVIDMLTRDREHKQMTTRLALLLADTCTDFVFAIGVPLGLQVTFLGALDMSNMMFLRDKFYNNRWFVSAIRQFQVFALVTTWDIVSLCVFQISLLYCLWKVQGMVSRHGQVLAEEEAIMTRKVLWCSGLDDLPSLSPMRSDEDYVRPIQGDGDATYLPGSLTPFKARLFRWLPVVHALVGTIAVTASFVARGVTSTSINGCQMYGYEWFKPQAVCIILEINCHRLHTMGDRETIAQILGSTDTKWLFSLVVTHCPALEIPPAIREIPSLYSIELFNCTLVRWDAEAAITASTNPQMTYLKFFRTEFANQSVPEGMLSPAFPDSMSQIIFGHTNLLTLPPVAHERWTRLYLLTMDHGLLTQIPWTVTQMASLKVLSLVNNSISSISVGDLDQLRLFRLMLSGNPLTSLPERLPDAVLQGSCRLELEDTEVQSLPSWLERFLKKHSAPSTLSCQTTAYGSSLCANRVSREFLGSGISNTSSDYDLTSIEWLLSKCMKDFQTTDGYFGLAIEDAQRILDPSQ